MKLIDNRTETNKIIMASAQKQYTKEMLKRFGYYATWNPGLSLKLGDIGVLKGSIFTKISDLESKMITFEIVKDNTKTTLEHNSQGSATLTTKASASVAPSGSVLADADVGIIIDFAKENSTLFKAANTVTPTIKDTIRLGETILKLFKDGTWNKDWVIITELVESESATIIISNKSNSKIELKANANVTAKVIDIADAKFEFSTQFSRGLETAIISQEGATPLFKIMGIKTRIFMPPVFKARGVRPTDLVTPSSVNQKGEVFFGEILELEDDYN